MGVGFYLGHYGPLLGTYLALLAVKLRISNRFLNESFMK